MSKHNLFELMNSISRMQKAFDERPELAADNEELRASLVLVEPLEEIFNILDENDGGQIQIVLTEATEKAAWFGELAGYVGILRWLEIPGSMEAFLSSVGDSDAGHS